MRNYAKSLRKLCENSCENYAKTMRKLCDNYANTKRKMCENNGKLMRLICEVFSVRLCFPVINVIITYAKLVTKFATSCRLLVNDHELRRASMQAACTTLSHLKADPGMAHFLRCKSPLLPPLKTNTSTQVLLLGLMKIIGGPDHP